MGGRGVPYRYGSRTDRNGRTQRRTITQLTRILRDMFPAAAATPIEHAWCGVLGVPRDWSPVVALDHGTGLGLAGGYAGNGVATSNLAGRTLCESLTPAQRRLEPHIRGWLRGYDSGSPGSGAPNLETSGAW